MLRSMTGFGKAEAEFQNKKYSIEVKSLNSKQLDASVRLPSAFRDKEFEMRNMIAQKLERGKVEFSIRVESDEAERTTTINRPLVNEYIKVLREIASQHGAEPNATELLNMAMRMPDVFKSDAVGSNAEEWAVLQQASERAIDALLEFRRREGLVLKKDILARINQIKNLSEQVSQYETLRQTNLRNKLMQALNEIGINEQLDKNRFEQELIYYLEKWDITEERVRLGNHLNYFVETVELKEDTGKKLGFIAQEIGREINTMGSKANENLIQRLVVEMKDELEKVKEQLMNIL